MKSECKVGDGRDGVCRVALQGDDGVGLAGV